MASLVVLRYLLDTGGHHVTTVLEATVTCSLCTGGIGTAFGAMLSFWTASHSHRVGIAPKDNDHKDRSGGGEPGANMAR